MIVKILLILHFWAFSAVLLFEVGAFSSTKEINPDSPMNSKAGFFEFNVTFLISPKDLKTFAMS